MVARVTTSLTRQGVKSFQSRSSLLSKDTFSYRQRITIGTFNVRGLSSNTKQLTLEKDLKKYDVDICGIQETKTQPLRDTILPEGWRLILFPQSSGRHRGIGLAVSPKLRPFLSTYWTENDRVGVADFMLPSNRFSNSRVRCRFIIAYGPTMQSSTRNPEERDKFWDSISKVWNEVNHRRGWSFILGDLNSKARVRTDADLESCLGRFGNGTRNENGTTLVNWAEQHGAFLCNTAFQHPVRHRTTWTCAHRDANDGSTCMVHNQIDYVLCQQKHKSLLQDARSYGGTELFSDHKPVFVKLDMSGMYLVWGKKTDSETQTPFNVAALSEPKKKEEFEKLTADLCSTMTPDDNPRSQLQQLGNCLQTAANQSIGTVPRKVQGKQWDHIIAKLSEEQRQLHLKWLNCKDDDKRKEVKRARNAVQRQIRDRALEVSSAKLDAVVDQINQAQDNTKMYQSTRILRHKPQQRIMVHDDEGHVIANEADTVERIASWFESLFSPSTEDAIPPPTPGPPLTPVTEDEVSAAIKRLNNNRACGADNIPAEFLKCTRSISAPIIANIVNTSLTDGTNPGLGEGVLIPLQKPNKAIGPLKNIRPVVLLTAVRKCISLIVLKRIQADVEGFLSPAQSGFRSGRSTADAVWSLRWLAGKVQRYQTTYHLLAIDMSRAFDTVSREKLLDVMRGIVGPDELRLIQLLLHETTLTVRCKSTTSRQFSSLIGTPQGDALSPVLFVCYLEAALRQARQQLMPRPISDSSIPPELEYADDMNLISTSRPWLEDALPVLADSFRSWNLHINEDKTEWVELNHASSPDEEPWRKTRFLGSLLGESQDISRRIQLAAAAYNTLQSLWLRRSRVEERRRLKLYEAFVLPVLLYNAGTWGVPGADLERLNVFHRKQLRHLLGIYHPDHISNDHLYARCNTTPIAAMVERSRWRLLGHVLRLSSDVPARQAMELYYTPCKAYRGAPRITLPVAVSRQLKEAGQVITNISGLTKLADTAADREQWRAIVRRV